MTQVQNGPAQNKPDQNKPSRSEHPHDAAPVDGGGHSDGHGGEHGVPTDLKAPSGFAVIIAVVAFVLLLAVLFVIGEVPHYKEMNEARKDAEERASRLPVVQYTTAVPESGTHDVILPCNVRANQSTAIFTRTSGYLKKWYFDIGQHVQAGQLMAEIETPEVDAQLAQSKASLEQNRAAVKKAEADKDLAQKTLDRYLESAEKSPGSVTKEAIDQNQSALKDADAALNQAQANVTAAEANVRQLQTQVDFEKVTAPFSGTVTARNYDVGALLSPTNNSPGSEIFDLAQTDVLRVFVSVPQEYANDIKVAPAKGQPTAANKARLYIRNFPAKPFEGIVTLTSGAVDPNTRTLNVQIDFPNKDGQLFAGEYGEIHLPVEDPESVGLIPTSALVFNAQAKGLQVAVVDDVRQKDNRDVGTVHLKSIKTARDFGTAIEVTSGISGTDKLITNPSERVNEGAQVEAHWTPNGAVPTSQPSKASSK